ncbi:MAG: hypothetical protein JRG97_15105 [Deltaproteobacteria bacterium]|nr:hypothetical protein [Deltaproteobacteria bacterium]
MLIKFWGVRGSIPTPIRTEQVSAKIKQALSLVKGVDLENEEAVNAFVEGLPLMLVLESGILDLLCLKAL